MLYGYSYYFYLEAALLLAHRAALLRGSHRQPSLD
jgi:hypothetical protein